MSDVYIAYHFTVEPLQPATDILIAELSERLFDSFVEHEHGLTAYILKTHWHDAVLEGLSILHNNAFTISYTKEDIPPVNWNKVWEKNFEPIEVDETVSIRAPFHESGSLKYNIIIEPKMSFGTGHHETTHLMIQQLLYHDLRQKRVLDMGTGTSVLAILTEMLGAQSIDAVDIDQWSYENATENVSRNHCKRISVYQGDASWLTHQSYDIILANITRNILLNDLPVYVRHLTTGGLIILSGFYQEDLPLIDKKASALSLEKKLTLFRHNWACVAFFKS